MKPIEVEHISKSYQSVKALTDISFEVNEAEIFGLIGPDGAGKTSLYRILTTVLDADNGNASVAGFDIEREFGEIRNRIGYMPGKFSLYQDLTVKENLEFYATIFGTTIQENYHLIRDIYVQLEPFQKRRAGKLSGGMKQKLALCCALIHKPEVLFLDEPTTGVDPVSRKEFWQMLKRLQKEGITILVSTPYMDEAALCDRIGLLQHGKLLSIQSPEKTRKLFRGQLISAKSKEMFRLLTVIRGLPGVSSCFTFGEYLNAAIQPSETSIEILVDELKNLGFADLEIKMIDPEIENVFMQLLANSH